MNHGDGVKRSFLTSKTSEAYMKNIKRYLALSLSIICVSTGCGMEVTEGTAGIASGNDAVAELPTADPKEDFFFYVNGEKIADAEFEYGAMSYDGTVEPDLVDDQVKDVIKGVVAGSGYEKGSEEDIIKTAYDLYLDYDFEAPTVPAELDALLHEIDSVTSVDELIALDVKLERDFGVSNMFNLSIDNDYLTDGAYVLSFSQYTGFMDSSFEDLEESYNGLNSLKDAGSTILQAMGHDKEYGDECGKALGLMVIDLYNATDMEIANSLMNYKYIKAYSAKEIDEIFTNVDIQKFLEAVGVDKAKCDRFTCVDEGQLKAVNEMLKPENLDALKTWRMAELAGKYRRFLASGYSELSKYRNIDYSTDEDRVLNEIMSIYEETDPLYVEKYYAKETDDALIALCDDVKEGYRRVITGADWLSDGTKKGLLTKLENIVYVTGQDSKRHDASKYKDLCTSDYFEFYRSYLSLRHSRDIEKLSKPLDRKEITMPMQMLNACYDPCKNNITITVAITNAPFYDAKADYFTNLGALGGVIAHEIGHAFDNSGILFDEKGVYDPSWIDSADVDKLNEKNEKAIRYFEDEYTLFGVYHVDGEQTLGENYADLGGLECILALTENAEQRKKLFEGYATSWCGKIVDTALIDQLDADVHSPGIVRVNAVVSTVDLFYDTYGVKEGDGMYVAPEKRISRW